MLCGISLVAGIILKSDTGDVLALPVITAAALFAIITIYAVGHAENERLKKRRILISGLIIISFLTGIIRVSDVSAALDSGYIPEGSKKETLVYGTVSDIQLSDTRYLISIENPKIILKNEEQEIADQGRKLLIYSESAPSFNVGDEVKASGTLYPFQEATNYGQFDQKKYYNAKGYGLKLYTDEVVLIKINDTAKGRFWRLLFDAGECFENALERIYDDRTCGILTAMLTGDRSGLDEDTKEIYKRIGIAHILSISGLHVTLLGMGLFNILMLLLKRLRLCGVLTIVFIVTYGVFTGFSVSTVRAVIMIICMLAGRMLLRAYDGQSAAALAAMIILVSNPPELFETGFQLSFIAVFGIFAGNIIRKNLGLKNPVFIYCIPGFFAQLATFPIILRTYYSFSPYSFAANMILLPFMSVIVISGLIAGICGCICIGTGAGIFIKLGMIAGGPAHFLLDLYNGVSEWMLSLPGADIITGCPKAAACFFYYLIFFCLIYMSNRYREKNVRHGRREEEKVSGKGRLTPVEKKQRLKECLRIYLVTCAALMLMYGLLMFKGRKDKVYAGFLDVGQGLCVYVETEDMNILTDGGSSNVQNVGKYRIEPFLLYRGVKEIDYCFVTHTDTDHISGIKEILQDGRIRIKKLVLGINYNDKEPLIALALEKGTEVVYAKAGDMIAESRISGNTDIKIYSPDPDFIYDDANQASLVFEIRYNDFTMLMTGDSDEFAESEYVRYLNGHEGIDVLQCPHHGSKYSCSERLLEVVKPSVTVISCSRTNNYGHPAGETLERLEEAGSYYYVTAEKGMISVYGDGGEEFKVKGYKGK